MVIICEFILIGKRGVIPRPNVAETGFNKWQKLFSFIHFFRNLYYFSRQLTVMLVDKKDTNPAIKVLMETADHAITLVHQPG